MLRRLTSLPQRGATTDDAAAMTVGELSRRTGVPVKALRQYTDWGLIYSVGRTAANYRQYRAEALWCVRLIRSLRGLGLTLAEIRELCRQYSERIEQPVGPELARLLRGSRARLDARIEELRQVRRRIDAFEAEHGAELIGRTGRDIWTDDPRGRGLP